MTWQQIAPIEELGPYCYAWGRFIAVARPRDAYFIWSVYFRRADGTFDSLNGIWSQFCDAPDVDDGLTWAEAIIADQTR